MIDTNVFDYGNVDNKIKGIKLELFLKTLKVRFTGPIV